MKRLVFAAILFSGGTAVAWESLTTHAGLAEQSALAAPLHATLQKQFGLSAGLYAPLRLDATLDKALIANMRRFLSPSLGYAPDARHSMSALGWLVAGSVLADQSRDSARYHFFDPRTGRGLPGQPSALEWLRHDDNPNSLAALQRHFVAAVTAAAPAERERQLALTLFAAGDILHLLADMGSPSHVRGDAQAHKDALGDNRGDRGSRFERVAALAYSRLGIPPAADIERRDAVTHYFSAPDRRGLADVTAATWFSPYTLPEPEAVPLGGSDKKLRTDAGVCKADLTVIGKKVELSIGDACVLEQLATILPQVAGYGAGLLDSLFSGDLVIRVEDGVVVSWKSPRTGRLSLYWDDKTGRRNRYQAKAIENAGEVAFPAPPAEAVAVVALFEGKQGDEKVLATGRVALPPPAR